MLHDWLSFRFFCWPDGFWAIRALFSDVWLELNCTWKWRFLAENTCRKTSIFFAKGSTKNGQKSTVFTHFQFSENLFFSAFMRFSVLRQCIKYGVEGIQRILDFDAYFESPVFSRASEEMRKTDDCLPWLSDKNNYGDLPFWQLLLLFSVRKAEFIKTV